MKPNGLRRKRVYAGLPQGSDSKRAADETAVTGNGTDLKGADADGGETGEPQGRLASGPKIPEGLMVKCVTCGQVVYNRELKHRNKVCPQCGAHFRMGAWERIALIADEGSFRESGTDVAQTDPLHFPGYEKKLAVLREKTGLSEAVVTGKAEIGGQEA